MQQLCLEKLKRRLKRGKEKGEEEEQKEEEKGRRGGRDTGGGVEGRKYQWELIVKMQQVRQKYSWMAQ